MKKRYCVYILSCSDGSYYTGVTNNIEARLVQHQKGYNSAAYTYTRRPVELKYCKSFTDIRKAIAWEKQLKGWSRKKKEALFVNNWDEIKRLARYKNPRKKK